MHREGFLGKQWFVSSDLNLFEKGLERSIDRNVTKIQFQGIGILAQVGRYNLLTKNLRLKYGGGVSWARLTRNIQNEAFLQTKQTLQSTDFFLSTSLQSEWSSLNLVTELGVDVMPGALSKKSLARQSFPKCL